MAPRPVGALPAHSPSIRQLGFVNSPRQPTLPQAMIVKAIEGLEPPTTKLFLLLEVISPAHALDAPLRVHYPLLSGVERMAFAANFYPKSRFGGPGFKHVSARTGDSSFVELRMNFGLHDSFTP